VKNRSNNKEEALSWITIGSFDGVHAGHQKILRILSKTGKEQTSNAIAVSFDPHPADFLGKIKNPFYLSTSEEKKALLKRYGADRIIIFNFNRAFSRQSPGVFIDRLQSKVPFSKLLIGYDFRLGADRSGGQQALSQLGDEQGFKVEIISALMMESQPISSSRIRQSLIEGDLEKANMMLGYPYIVTGKVVHGDGRGKHIGLPTANILPWKKKLVPSAGVYAAFSEIDGHLHPSVVSIGYRPTFYAKGAQQSIESHILEFSREIYDKEIVLHFVKKLRAELKFGDVDALMKQIKYDMINAKEILAHAEQPPNLFT